MPSDKHSIEDLTALYVSQSPVAFTALAMSTQREPHDFSKRIDEQEHGDDSKCDYPCCNERGCCPSLGWYVALCGGIGCLCLCCCYVSDGFCGHWTYWPN